MASILTILVEKIPQGESLIHMIAETNRHAGHADIVRETIDGATDYAVTMSHLASSDEQWWAHYRERLEHSARAAAERWEN